MSIIKPTQGLILLSTLSRTYALLVDNGAGPYVLGVDLVAFLQDIAPETWDRLCEIINDAYWSHTDHGEDGMDAFRTLLELAADPFSEISAYSFYNAEDLALDSSKIHYAYEINLHTHQFICYEGRQRVPAGGSVFGCQPVTDEHGLDYYPIAMIGGFPLSEIPDDWIERMYTDESDKLNRVVAQAQGIAEESLKRYIMRDMFSDFGDGKTSFEGGPSFYREGINKPMLDAFADLIMHLRYSGIAIMQLTYEPDLHGHTLFLNQLCTQHEDSSDMPQIHALNSHIFRSIMDNLNTAIEQTRHSGAAGRGGHGGLLFKDMKLLWVHNERVPEIAEGEAETGALTRLVTKEVGKYRLDIAAELNRQRMRFHM